MNISNIILLNTILNNSLNENPQGLKTVFSDITGISLNSINTFDNLATLIEQYMNRENAPINTAIFNINTDDITHQVFFMLVNMLITESISLTSTYDINQYSYANRAVTQDTNIVYAPVLPLLNGDCRLVFQNCTRLIMLPQLDYSKSTNLSNLFNGCIMLKEIGVLYAPKCTQSSNVFTNCALSKIYAYLPISNSLSINNTEKTLQYVYVVGGRFFNISKYYGLNNNKIEIDFANSTGVAGFSRFHNSKYNSRIAPYIRITNKVVSVYELFYNESSTRNLEAINARHWDTSSFNTTSTNAGAQGSFVGYTIGLFSQFVNSKTFAKTFGANVKNVYMMGDTMDSAVNFNRNSYEGTVLTLVNSIVTINQSATDYIAFQDINPISEDTYLNTNTMECFSYDGQNWIYERTIHPDQVGFEYGKSTGYKGTDISINNNVITDNSSITPKLGDTYLNTDTMDAFVYTDDFTLVHGLLNATASGTALYRDWDSTNKIYNIIEDSTSADYAAYLTFKSNIQVNDTYYNSTLDQYFTWLEDEQGNGCWKWRQASRWDCENAHWHKNSSLTPSKIGRSWFYVWYNPNYPNTNTHDEIHSFVVDKQTPLPAANPHWEWRCQSCLEVDMNFSSCTQLTKQSIINLISHAKASISIKLRSNIKSAYENDADVIAAINERQAKGYTVSLIL